MPDLNFFINALTSCLELLLVASVSCFVGAIFEARNWVSVASCMAKPLIRYGRLPDICGVSFLTAILSNNAANSMIAGACGDGSITRREMLLSALANSFPTKVYHNLKVIYIVPLLGTAGVIYFLIQLTSGLLRTFVVMSVARFTHQPTQVSVREKEHATLTWPETFKKARKRTKKLLLKIIKIALPLYLIINYIVFIGALDQIDSMVPATMESVFNGSVLSIIAARMVNLVSAARHATDLLNSGEISVCQIVIALMAGNILTMPFRTFRRSLATALSIFSKRDGLLIVGIVQGWRFITSLIVIIILIKIDSYL